MAVYNANGQRIDEGGGGGGTGWTTEEVNLFETILKNLVYKSAQKDNVDALIASLRGEPSTNET